MNKKTEFLIIGLILWNFVLSYFVVESFSRKNNVLYHSGNPTQVTQNLTTFETDFTKVIASHSSKVVGVTSYGNGIQYRTGSGVIYQVHEDGIIIITNSHLILATGTVDVMFGNGEVLRAEVIGTDDFTDIAVLRVNPEFDVAPFTIGDSSLVKAGEWVIALGSPGHIDVSGSVAVGIISGKDRQIPIDLDLDGYTDWSVVVLETDVTINFGNTGGPLLNLDGELIGINTMHYGYNGTSGISFATPINEVIPIVNRILSEGVVVRGRIGIHGISVTEIPAYSRDYYGIDVRLDYGVLITSVTEAGIEKTIGLQIGDIILAINNEKINDFKEFRKQIYTFELGDTITIQYQRNNQVYDVEVVLQ